MVWLKDDRFSMIMNYSDKNYWENHYKQSNTHFEWYCDPDQLESGIFPHLSFVPPVLVVGCGNSLASEILKKKKIGPIISIDLSPTVIEQMNAKFDGSYLCMDATNLQFRDHSFKTIFDKGTLDSLMCAYGFEKLVVKFLKEVFRVLEIGGHFIEICFQHITFFKEKLSSILCHHELFDYLQGKIQLVVLEKKEDDFNFEIFPKGSYLT